MKQCDYCAKEISYHELYCSETCQQKVEEYYRIRTKLQKLISAINIIGTCLIGVGIFLYAISNAVGAMMIAIGGLSTGLSSLLLPCPTDNIIKKYKLAKAQTLIRIFGIVLIVFGTAALILSIIKM